MHDTETMVLDLRWFGLELWHKEPHEHASGWAYPPLTDWQLKQMRQLAWTEAHTPHFLRQFGRKWIGPVCEAECLERGLYLMVAKYLHVKLSFQQASEIAAEKMHGGMGDSANKYCYEPGYHTNRAEDTITEREDYFAGVACSIARDLLRRLRPWYKHPRFHFWHWKIRCFWFQSLKNSASAVE